MNAYIDSIRFNFLYIDFYSFGATWVYPENYLPYGLMRCIVKGTASFIVDGKEIIVTQGEDFGDEEFKPLLTGEAARNAIFTADACTKSKLENRKVKLSELQHLLGIVI